MSRLIETIRVSGGKLQNLDYHLRRIRQSAPKWDFNELFFPQPSHGIHKIRIVYDQEAASITIEPYTIRQVRTLKLVTDNNVVYDQKFEDRKALEKLFAQRGDCDDILIIKNGAITDASFANIIFRGGDHWVTPASYLLNGTMRQYLLDTRQISEQRITPGDLAQFSHFKLINAMLRDEAPESEVSNIR